MFRYIRTFGVLALMFAVTLAPVAPAFAQSQGQALPPAKDPTQGQPPPPAQPKKVDDQGRREYTHGNPAFPNLLAPYTPLHIADPDLKNTAHLQQFMKDGKLYLSVQDVVALALENDLDIAVQSYAPWIADTNILSAASGVGTRYSFDPTLTLASGVSHSNLPVSNPFTVTNSGVSAFTSHSINGNLTYAQGFDTGTQLTITQNNSRTSTSANSTTFNPQVQSSMTVQVTQQLLNGFGRLPNTRFIKVARNNQKISDLAFKQQIITSVTQVQIQYWELVFAIQNVTVAQHAVDLATRLYSDNKKQVEIGTLAPLDVTNAQAQVSTANQTLIQAQTTLLQDQLALLSLITKDPLGPFQNHVEIVPTDSTYSPANVEDMPLDQAVREALANRPDYNESQINLNSDDLNIRALRNGLLPTLSLTGQYSWQGLAGVKNNSSTVIPGVFVANLNSPIVGANGVPIPGEFNAIPATTPPATPTTSTGLGDTLNQIFSNQFPGYAMQFNFIVPIRNRSAQSASIAAMLTQKQDLTRLQQQQNVIVVAIRNAQIQLIQARAALAAATQSRVLEEQTIDADQKKLQLGATTPFQVIQDQRDLANAAGAEARALVNLVEAKVNFDNAMGRTLQVNNIQVSASKGNGSNMGKDTLIPGTHADGSLVIDDHN